jgi:hypothetical protein
MQHSTEIATSVTMQRRSFLKLGVGTAAVLALAGGGIALLRPGLENGHLTPAGRAVFEAVGRAVLDGSLPIDAAQRRAALDAHLQRLDDAIAAFPAAVQSELSQLITVLAAAPGRVMLAGLRTDWPQASIQDIQTALNAMRYSSLALRQQAYHALRDLTNAAYYADLSTWALMGYPGPRAL